MTPSRESEAGRPEVWTSGVWTNRARALSGAVTTLVLALAAMAGPASPAESAADSAGAARLAMRFELIENQHGGEPRFLAELTLANRGGTALAASGWTLYFNFGRPLSAAGQPGELDVAHVNGDLWRLTPGEAFTPLPAGEQKRFRLLGYGAVSRRSDAPAGPYVVFGDERAEAISDYTIAPFPDIARLRRYADDRVPVATAEESYERNEALRRLPEDGVGRLVPTPLRLDSGSRSVVLDPAWKTRFGPGLEGGARALAEALQPHLGSPPAPEEEAAEEAPARAAGFVLRTAPLTLDGAPRGAGDEAYRLTVDRDVGVEIVGTDPAGVFYGIQSLRGLLPIAPRAGEAVTLQEIVVEDAPRFSYRGLHLDVARNFHDRQTVEKLLRLAAFYKLNRFHFHLTDDEGWRLPVAALPELTEIGGRRGHTADESDRLMPSYGSGPDPDPAVSSGSGAYTRDDLLAILRFAGERHIRVIPEIDVPGHARAAIKAMAARHARLIAAGREDAAETFLLYDPEDRSEYRSVQGWTDNVINVCLPSTYRFLETVFDEVVGLWAAAGAPLEEIHVGGDEVPAGVWQGSPACRRLIQEDPELDGTDDLWGYFLRRVNDILAARGLATAGWEEIALIGAGSGEHAKKPNEAFLDRGFRPWVWNNIWGLGAEDLGYRLANAGYPVVLANATNLYFDLAYENHPEETGYAWAGFVDTRKPWELVPLDLYKSARTDPTGRPIDPAKKYADSPRLTAEGRERIRGIQGQLWAENSISSEVLEYQAFPKLLGLAERAWAAQPDWARIEDTAERRRREAVAWNEFANRLGRRELPRLDRFHGGVLYRLPPPGAVVRDGLLAANTAFPGLEIRYTTDGSEPVASSTLYSGPLEVGGTVKLSTFDTRGRASRSVAVPAGD